MIKLLIADDNDEIRNYFRKVLSREDDMQIIGMAKSGAEALDLAIQLEPNVVIMDIEMESRTDGIDSISKIKAVRPDIKCVVLTIHQEDEYLFQAYAAGAMDYLVKTTSIVEILTSIRRVHQNQMQMRPEIAESILSEFSRMRNERASLLYTLGIFSKLTNAEIDIIRAVYKGKSYSEIARERHVEKGTVKTQVNHILRKFYKHRMSDVISMLEESSLTELPIFNDQNS